jgi:hypothetical protein
MAVAGRDEPRERFAAGKTNDALADGKAVWSWHPLLVSSWRRRSRPNRVDQPYSPMTVTTRIRSPGRARNKPLKPLRAGMPGDSGGPVVTTLVCFTSLSHARLWVHWAPGIPHALFGRKINAQLGRIAPRDRKAVFANRLSDCHRPSAGRPNGRPMTGSGGRSSIPELSVIESRSRGVLDTAHGRGMTACVGAPSIIASQRLAQAKQSYCFIVWSIQPSDLASFSINHSTSREIK